MFFLVDEMVKLQGSRESSSSARKKEKPRKLFHESASKSASVTNQSDPGTFDFLFIKRNFACIASSFSRPTCHEVKCLLVCDSVDNKIYTRKMQRGAGK
jgi:hypothetical protein